MYSYKWKVSRFSRTFVNGKKAVGFLFEIFSDVINYGKLGVNKWYNEFKKVITVCKKFVLDLF